MVTVNTMGNKIGKEQYSKLQEMMKAHPTLVSLCGIADDATEANLSGLGMDADDAVVLADELPAKRALASVNILKNKISAKQAQALVDIMRSKDSLVTLCGLTGTETELDFSNQKLGAGDAVLIANDIRDNGALASLDLSQNGISESESSRMNAFCEAKSISLKV